MTTVTKTTVRATLTALVLMAAFLMGSALPSHAQATLYAPPQTAPDVTAPYSGLWLGTHLWMADHLMGLCRLDVNPTTGIADYNRTTCKTDAIAPTQPSYDPITNMVYVGDTSAKSLGVYRYQFDPVSQTLGIGGGTLIAPNAGLGGNQPMSTAIGPDGNLYIGFQKNGNIVRIPNPSGLSFTQTAQVIGSSSNGKIVHSLAFVGTDLYLAETNNVTVITNAVSTLCTGGCKAAATQIKVTVPSGLYYDKTANIMWIASTPQTNSTIYRYNFATNITDVMDTNGTIPATATAPATNPLVYFVFGFAQDTAGNIYFGDDPSAGQSPFVGHIWMLAAGSVPVVAGTAPPPPAPGPAPAPAPSPAPLPPPLPALTTGVLYSTGETAPNGGVWMGTHFWVSDNINGFCRIDGTTMNLATCVVNAAKPGQPAFDAHNNLVYVPDFSATKSVGVWRYNFDPISETIVGSIGLAPNAGLGGNAPDAVALNPDDGNLYVGFLKNGNIVRITTPTLGTQLVQTVGTTSDGRKSKGLGFIKQGINPANLWIAEVARVTMMFNPANPSCTGGCKGVLMNPSLDLVAPFALTTDGVDKVYWSNTSVEFGFSDIHRYVTSTGTDLIYVNQFSNPATATLGRFFSSMGLTLDPAGNLFVGDDPNGGLAPFFQGHVTKVNLVP